MEENPWELDSIYAKTFSYLSLLSTDPLFSSIITLYTLILLYFPRIFLKIIFSPVLIFTAILLLTLLRLGALQRLENENNSTEPQESESPNEDLKWVEPKSEIEPEYEVGFNLNSIFIDSFVEWNVRAPLEVIFEEYEGEETEDPNEKEETRLVGLESFNSLSFYYPESDTETSSDDDFPAMGDWDSPDEEEREGGLIEIALDNDGKRGSQFHHVEEENMIEIDISSARNGDFPGDDR